MTTLQRAIWLSLLVLVGCGGPEPETVIEPVSLVTIEPAVISDLPVILQTYGSVEFDPAEMRTLSTEIEARVLELGAVAGAAVTRDQVLVRLAPSSAGGTEVAQARLDASAARTTAARTRRLRGDGLASDADVEAADTAATGLAALASSLEARSGAIVALRAPADTVVDGLFAGVGDLIAPGTTIVRLASQAAVQARLGIEVEDTRRLHRGMQTHLRSLDNSGIEVDAVISVIDARIDPTTRMASALVTIPAGTGLLAGEAVLARIIASTHAAAVVVPRAAVFEDETGSYVFVADKDMAVLTRVEVGLTSGEKTEILTGVAAGTSVVVEGASTLSDGRKIRTVAAGSTT